MKAICKMILVRLQIVCGRRGDFAVILPDTERALLARLMRIAIPAQRRHRVSTIHLPRNLKDKHDPLGQRGYIGWHYHGCGG